MTDTTGNLLAIIADIRQALGTPDDVDVRENAKQVAAKAQKWDAVPWETIAGTVCSWELDDGRVSADDMHDLRTWFDRNKPKEYAE
jgi:hypothetical protein